jgi:hypothetical protein
VLVQFHIILHQRRSSPSKHEGATLRKIGAKQYYVDSNTKNSKEPSSKREPRVLELKWTSLYSTNMTWKQRSTIVNFYHKYFATYVNKQLKEPFPTFMAYTLNMDVIIYDVYSTFTPDITNMWILSKMIEDTVVKCKILR